MQTILWAGVRIIRGYLSIFVKKMHLLYSELNDLKTKCFQRRKEGRKGEWVIYWLELRRKEGGGGLLAPEFLNSSTVLKFDRHPSLASHQSYLSICEYYVYYI